jgi:hypothetical protein
MHWAEAFFGARWQLGAQGPETFDCWSFFRHVQRARYGIEVPLVMVPESGPRAYTRAFQAHLEWEHWVRVDRPEDGDAVPMSLNTRIHHIGIWLAADGGGVLHCLEGGGVAFSTLGALRAALWRRIEFYRHESRLRHLS